MAGEAPRAIWTSYRDYLALEQSENKRFEWVNGQVFAMAGGTLSHAELGAAVLRELGNLALACGCKVFSADAKVRALETGLATYPDASVVCGSVERDPEDPHAMTNPAVLIEVLSDGTERYDRGEKAEHYRHIPSLRDYVLVSQHTARIEVHSRAGDHWTLRVLGPGEVVPLTAMPGTLSVDRIYQGVELSPAPAPSDRSHGG